MPLNKPFAELIPELLDLLTKDVIVLLRRLQEALPQASPRQDEILLLLSRFNKARELSSAGAANQQEIEIMENAARRDVLLLVRDLKEEDFEPPVASGASGNETSNLLYRIPHTMPMEVETLCIVRIATDPGVLEEDFRTDEHTEKRHLKRISKSMMVEINDPSGDKNFIIRPDSRSVQTIDLEGLEFTEWRIYVQPLHEGDYMLELKVCVIEVVDGEKEVRERVLEEQVQVIAEGEPTPIGSVPEKKASAALAFLGPQMQNAAEPAASDTKGPTAQGGLGALPKGVVTALKIFVVGAAMAALIYTLMRDPQPPSPTENQIPPPSDITLMPKGEPLPPSDTDTMPDVEPDPKPDPKPGPKLGPNPEPNPEPKSEQKTPKEPPKEKITDPLLGSFILVKEGTFEMGHKNGRDDWDKHYYYSVSGHEQKPLHKVTLSSFYLAETEVTQAQWRKKMGRLPDTLSIRNCDNCPVEGVSWLEIQQFIERLNQDGAALYRLPTEAEWEYAARGGHLQQQFQFSGSDNIDEVARYYGNSDEWIASVPSDRDQEPDSCVGETDSTRYEHAWPVKSRLPNNLGFYDMSGNVYEWCSD